MIDRVDTHRLFSGFVKLLAIGWLIPAAFGTCTPGSGTVTCTGGPSATVNDPGGSTTVGTSSALAVTGGSGTVKTVTVVLHGYTAVLDVNTLKAASRDMGLLLKSPGGRNLELMRCVGEPGSGGQNNLTFTIQDGATAFPDCNGSTGLTAGGTFAASSYPDSGGSGNAHPDYSTIAGVSSGQLNSPATQGSATFTSVFTGDSVDGTWTLYLASDAPSGFQSSLSFSSWDITITFTQASSPSTTSLSLSNSTVFTSSPNNATTLTATVAGSGGTPTGTVTFKDGSTTLTCTQGAQPRALSSGVATCTTSFSSEGIHTLSATYSGDGTFVASSGTASLFTQNHATNTGTTYCNTGAVSGDGRSDQSFTNIAPYPSVIFVGDGVNTDITNPVETVSLQLKTFSEAGGASNMHMLLVAPDGTHGLDFWGDAAGPVGSGNYTFQDGATQLPSGSSYSAGTYGPTSYSSSDSFTPAPPSPAPQLPGSFSLAPPAGSKTFGTSFVGATAHGAWALFLYNASGTGDTTSAAGGWCLTITPGTGQSTTVTVQSSPLTATKGNPVTFTASVSSTQTVNQGTVTFTENGSPLAGAPNSGVASVSNGTATISTSSLPEGDHTVTALYHDPANSFADNFGTVTMRVDAATATPTLAGSTWSYCNPSGITIPAGTVFVNDIGPAGPNPTNVAVSNLFGTVSSVSVTFKGLHVTSPGDLETLLVGPNGASPIGTAQTFDFFSLTGGSGGATAFGPQDTAFADVFSVVPANGPVSSQDGATSRGATSYTASPFFTLPATLQHATPTGSFTFNTGVLTGTSGGVYAGADPNGTWSVYFNQLIHHVGDGATSWCLGFVENPVSVSITEGHTGSAPNNHFVQGEQTAQLTTSITNNGPGSTGDPDGNHPLTVTDTLNSAFSYVGFTGTGWSCSAVSQVVTCLHHGAIADTASYPLLTINVNVSATATTGPVSNSVQITGGGASSNSASDSITIDAAPVLSISKTHTGNFTQGQSAEWDIAVSNTAAGSNTVGTTNVSDALPSGYTITSIVGSGWNCAGSVGTATLSCASTQTVAGSSAFPTLQMTVSVPADSATSVSNTAKAWGGGDLTHISSATAAASTDGVTVVQVAATITVTSGGTQSTAVNTVFPTALGVVVKDAGGVVIPSAPVTYTAPSTGASGTFSNSTATITANTNGSGALSETFTANGTAGGPYTVTATAGTASTSFSLTNNATNVNITLDTSPTGLQISNDGGTTFHTAPYTFSASIGSPVTIATSSPQGTGTQYNFASWSDAGAISHQITVPSTATTYTASFSTSYLLTINVSPGGGGTATPASGSYYTSASVVNVSATPNSGYNFSSWSGPVTNPANAATTVTMNAPTTLTANFTAGTTNLALTIAAKSGPQNARVWTFNIKDTGPGAANGAQLTSFSLQQLSGAACSPVLSTSLPLALGSIAPGATTQANVTIDFTGCGSTNRYAMTVSLSANGGSTTATISQGNQFQ
ncbi:MAG: Ig-like domain repeat protein [Acidobacteriia bacterium]|nr:Ig-like domain repeat protein [Terriglobia bacterium]